MKIPLTNGGFTLIDHADYPLVKMHRWRRSNPRKPHSCYAVCDIQVKGKFRLLAMHTLLIKVPRGYEPDHANRNKLDNRRKNLRVATPSQNHANVGRLRRNTSGFKGVSRSRYGKWEVRISYHNTDIYVGSFTNKTIAAHAYDLAAIHFFGPFACLNFPQV